MQPSLIIQTNSTFVSQQSLTDYLTIALAKQPWLSASTQLIWQCVNFDHPLTIEEVRTLKEQLTFNHGHQVTTIYVLTHLTETGIPAQNSLLKLLEEPPARTIFILVTNGLNHLLPTIVSRCQLINQPSTLTESEYQQLLLTWQVENWAQQNSSQLAHHLIDLTKEQNLNDLLHQLRAAIDYNLHQHVLINLSIKQQTKIIQTINHALKLAVANVSVKNVCYYLAITNVL